MATVRELTVRFGFKVDEAKLRKFDKSIRNVRANLLKVVAAGAVLGAGLFKLTESVAKSGDFAAKMSVALGLSAAALQELTFAAEIGGVAQAELVTGIRTLARGAKEAADGVASYKDAFDELGVSVTGTDGKLKESDEILQELSDRFSKLPNNANKTALSLQIFGRAGAKMIPFLNQGSKGIQELRDEAQRLGIVLDDETTKRSEEFNDSMLRARMAMRGIKNTIGTALLPGFINLATKFKDYVASNQEFIKQKMPQMLKLVAAAATLVGVAMAGVVAATVITSFISLVFMLRTVVAGFKTLILMIKTTAAFVRILGKEFILAELKALAIPIALIAAAVVLGLFIDDMVSFLQGHESVIGSVLGKYKEWRQTIIVLGSVIAGVAIVALSALSPLVVMTALLVVTGIAIARVWTPINKIFEDLARNIDNLGKAEGFKQFVKELGGFIFTEGPLFKAISTIGKGIGTAIPKTNLGSALGAGAPAPATTTAGPGLAGVLMGGNVRPTPMNPAGVGRTGAPVTINEGDITINGVGNPEQLRTLMRQENDARNRELKRNLGQ